MDNQNFLNEEWIVAPKTLHQSIMESRLNDQPAIRGVRLMTLDTLLATLFPVINENSKLFTSAYSIIQEKRKDCIVLKETISYPEFTRQVIDFVIYAMRNDVDINLLPQDSPKEKDLAVCIEAISPLFLSHNILKQLHLSPMTFSHLTIYPFYTQPHQQKIIDLLVERGARKVEIPSIPIENFSYFQALNPRQEAEAVAQWLCDRSFHRIGIIHCDPTGAKMLESVFDRYNIPFQQVSRRLTPNLVFRFLALLHLIKRKDSESLIEALTHGTFACTNRQSLIDYIQHFDLSVEQVLHPFNHVKTVCESGQLKYIDKRNQRALRKMEYEANVSQGEILADLINILSSTTPYITAFNHFAKDFALLCEDDKHALLAIKDILEQCLVEDSSAADIVIPYLIEQIAISKPEESASVIVTDLQHIELPHCDVVLVLGMNQRNFPGFSTKTGLFDEEYYAKTPLPSLKQRLNIHMDYVESIFSRYNNLICSYTSGNYEGKAVSSAYQVDVIAKKQGVKCSLWPLVHHGKSVSRTYQLDPALSQSLFFNENTLGGSVSSFERFFQCPYQYYFQYGLNLSKLQSFELNSAFVGTIQHAVFENLAQISPKGYPKTSKEDLSAMLDSCFKDLHLLYPKSIKQWDIVQARMLENLMVTFERLNPMEDDTDFEIKHQEYKFSYTWPTRHEISIALKGIIDRIDMTPTTFRIVDYKSSAKRLKKDKVLGGLQLQLLTYLIITSKLFNKTPVGAFYLSMRNLDVSVPRYKIAKKEVVNVDVEQYDELIIKKHKLTGWFVVDKAEMFKSKSFVMGLNNNNNIGSLYKFDLMKIEELFTEIYSYLVNELSNGNIQRRPTESACTYCDYASICWYKGKVEDPLRIADIEISMGKGDEA
jgi:ATP-dependent helicase/nuclease subunit B